MAAGINHEERVGKYFTAWENYDMDLLKAIFLPTAKYIVRRKKTLCGIDEILKYWERNKKRQKKIQLHWKIIASGFKSEVVQFGAYFWDAEDKKYTKINGQIIFKYDGNSRISSLTEAYKKRTT